MTGIILYIVAVLLLWILSPVFILYAIIRTVNKDKYFYDVAFGIDQLGNVLGAPLMNDLLIKKTSKHKYGNPDETISYVTGLNYKDKSLTLFGLLIVKRLNSLDENHVEKAVKNEQ